MIRYHAGTGMVNDQTTGYLDTRLRHEGGWSFYLKRVKKSVDFGLQSFPISESVNLRQGGLYGRC